MQRPGYHPFSKKKNVPEDTAQIKGQYACKKIKFKGQYSEGANATASMHMEMK